MKIMLACAAGMSTSLLVNKMREAAQTQGIDVEIFAAPEMQVAEYKHEVDLVLLGPQVSYLLEDIKEVLKDVDVPVEVVNVVDYGMMNGGKVLADALKLIK